MCADEFKKYSIMNFVFVPAIDTIHRETRIALFGVVLYSVCAMKSSPMVIL